MPFLRNWAMLGLSKAREVIGLLQVLRKLRITTVGIRSLSLRFFLFFSFNHLQLALHVIKIQPSMCAHLNNQTHAKQQSTTQRNRVSPSNNMQAHNLSPIKLKHMTYVLNEKCKVIRTKPNNTPLNCNIQSSNQQPKSKTQPMSMN